MVEGYNWDHYANVNNNISGYRSTTATDISITMGCESKPASFRSLSMPNSLVTFNRFWESSALFTPAATTDTVAIAAGALADQPAISLAFFTQLAVGANPIALNCP